MQVLTGDPLLPHIVETRGLFAAVIETMGDDCVIRRSFKPFSGDFYLLAV
jgi:hypothetical protein